MLQILRDSHDFLPLLFVLAVLVELFDPMFEVNTCRMLFLLEITNERVEGFVYLPSLLLMATPSEVVQPCHQHRSSRTIHLLERLNVVTEGGEFHLLGGF